MKNHIVAGDRGSQGIDIEKIRLDQTEMMGLHRTVKEAALPSGEVVVANDAVTGGKKPVNQTAANEPGCSGYKRVHINFLAKTHARISMKLDSTPAS